MPRFCSNCGAKLQSDSMFCTNCGTKIPSDVMVAGVNNFTEKSENLNNSNAKVQKIRDFILRPNEIPDIERIEAYLLNQQNKNKRMEVALLQLVLRLHKDLEQLKKDIRNMPASNVQSSLSNGLAMEASRFEQNGQVGALPITNVGDEHLQQSLKQGQQSSSLGQYVTPIATGAVAGAAVHSMMSDAHVAEAASGAGGDLGSNVQMQAMAVKTIAHEVIHDNQKENGATGDIGSESDNLDGIDTDNIITDAEAAVPDADDSGIADILSNLFD